MPIALYWKMTNANEEDRFPGFEQMDCFVCWIEANEVFFFFFFILSVGVKDFENRCHWQNKTCAVWQCYWRGLWSDRGVAVKSLTEIHTYWKINVLSQARPAWLLFLCNDRAVAVTVYPHTYYNLWGMLVA